MTHPNYFASADGQPARTRAGRCPRLPVARSAASRRWGLLICYEGVYPYVSGDFAQMEGLVAQGATSFVWSVSAACSQSAHIRTHSARDLESTLFAPRVEQTGVRRATTGRNGTTDVILEGLGKLYCAQPILRFGSV